MEIEQRKLMRILHLASQLADVHAMDGDVLGVIARELRERIDKYQPGISKLPRDQIISLSGEWYEVRADPRIQDSVMLPMFASTLPRDVQEQTELNGVKVFVGEELYTIVGLELDMHSPPWRQGEKAGFALAKPNPSQ